MIKYKTGENQSNSYARWPILGIRHYIYSNPSNLGLAVSKAIYKKK